MQAFRLSGKKKKTTWTHSTTLPKEPQVRQPRLLLCFLLCSSCHQQQVAGHKLDVEHVTGVSSIESHQFAGWAVHWCPTVGVADVPHPHRVVHRWGCHQAAVWAEGQTGDAVCVSPQVFEQSPWCQVPQFHPLVLTSRCQVLPIRWESEWQHRAPMARKKANGRPLLGAPEPDRLVCGASS